MLHPPVYSPRIKAGPIPAADGKFLNRIVFDARYTVKLVLTSGGVEAHSRQTFGVVTLRWPAMVVF